MTPQDFAVIVLASGLSERFGPENKLLAVLQDKPVINHVIDRLDSLRFGGRYGVTSSDPEMVEAFETASFHCVINDAPKRGQAHSLSLGAAKVLEDGWTRAVIVLGDMPFIETVHMADLMTELSNCDAVFSVWEHVKMPPVAVGLKALRRFADMPFASSGKQHLTDLSVRTLPLSARSAKDIDTRQDLQFAGKTVGHNMHGIDETREFKPIRIAVLTVSDTRTSDTDTSGQILADRIVEAGHVVGGREIVRDDIPTIRGQVQKWIEDPKVDAIISTGGTGLTGRDRTPEAVRPLFEKEIEGFSIIFHMKSYETVGLSTLQSRACAGLSNNTFIFCLPGSNGAVKDGWDKVIKAQLDSRHKPCNLIELLPRLGEG